MQVNFTGISQDVSKHFGNF